MNRIAKNKYIWALVVFGVIFFVIYSWLQAATYLPMAKTFNHEQIFSWPDAMANNFFIKEYIRSGSFSKFEPLNSQLQNIIHPRSANVTADGSIVPMSFLGMIIIYGWLGKLIGATLITFLAPLLAAAGGLFFFGIIKRIFNQPIALISTMLLWTFSTYWYYANLVMLPTTLFVFLVMAGMYFFIRTLETDSLRPSLIFAGSAGLFLGLAAITRSTEVIWIFAIIIISAIFYRKKIKLMPGLIFLLCVIIPLLVLLHYNHETYGKYFTFGYLKINQAAGFVENLPDGLEIQRASGVRTCLKLIFAPFGFHEKLIAKNFYKYFVKALWPYVLLFTLGATLWLSRAKRGDVPRAQIVYTLGAAVAGGWLVIYYGSWEFADPLVLAYNTIGSSYMRYWLPLNILMLPLIGYLLYQLLAVEQLKILKYLLFVVALCFLITFSICQTYYSPNDGLIAEKNAIAHYYEQAEKVADKIEPDAIIIADRTDKLFFPAYRVVMFDLDYSIFPQLGKLLPNEEIYYFSPRSSMDMDYINERKIGSAGLKFTDPLPIDQQFNLYKLSQISPESR